MRIALLSMLLLVLAGCDRGDPAGPESPKPLYTPAEATIILPPEEESTVLGYDSGAGTLILDGNSAYSEDVEIGSILVGQDDDAAPNGLLCRVTSASSQRGTLVLDTEPALLTDAFEQMALSDSVQLRTSQILSSRLFNGTQVISGRDDETFSVDLDCILYDADGNVNTTGDQIRLAGTIGFSARLFAEIDIEGSTLERLEVGIVTDQEANLELSAGLEWEFTSEQSFELWQIGLGAIPLGGVVWVVPTLEAEVYIHGDLSVTIETGITYTQEMRNGFGYRQGANPEFNTISRSEKHFSYTPPQFSATLDFETGASLNAACLLYGVAGPYMAGKTGLHFESTISGGPDGQELTLDLEAILYAVVGLEMDTWVFDLDWNRSYVLYRHAIGTWSWSLGSGGGDYVLIPAGSFLMGAPDDELGTSNDERPQHTVTLTHDFNLQSTEVTNQQYIEMAQWAFNRGYATVASGKLRDALDGSNEVLVDLNNPWCEITLSDGVFLLRDVGHGINGDHPMKAIRWAGAAAYCDWLSLQAGLPRAYNHANWLCNGGNPYEALGYRLPTEAEWEYACRAGSTTAFASGQIAHTGCTPLDPVLNQIGWYCGNTSGWTHPVGHKSPNTWGLYDMHGNLWECCNDWYTYLYYTISPSTDPVGPPTGDYHVVRGGAWNYDAQVCRSAFRNAGFPPGGHLGFRPARSAN